MHPGILFLLFTSLLGIAKGSQSISTVLADRMSVEETYRGALLFEREARSVVECAATCMSIQACKSVTTSSSYLSFLITCHGYAFPTTTAAETTAATTPTTAATTTLSYSNFSGPWIDAWIFHRSEWLERSCSSEPDCGGDPVKECVKGTCLCSPGYYYSRSRDSCMENCTLEQQLHTQFLVYQGFHIHAYNLLPCLHSSSEAACLQWCSIHVQIRSCDFWYPPQNQCCAQGVTRLGVPPGNWREDPQSKHYQKMCI